MSSQPVVPSRKERFEAWLTPENKDFIYRLMREERRSSMSGMTDELITRLRIAYGRKVSSHHSPDGSPQAERREIS